MEHWTGIEQWKVVQQLSRETHISVDAASACILPAGLAYVAGARSEVLLVRPFFLVPTTFQAPATQATAGHAKFYQLQLGTTVKHRMTWKLNMQLAVLFFCLLVCSEVAGKSYQKW